LGKKKLPPDVKKIIRDARKNARNNFLQNLFYKHLKMMYPKKSFNYEYYIENSTSFYLLDIVVVKQKLDIEVDGKKYHQNKAKDKHRDEFLRKNGWTVIRVNAKHVLPIIRGNIEFYLP